MTEPHTPCPVCQTECTVDTSDEGTQSMRPAGLTMQELREWLVKERDLSRRLLQDAERSPLDRAFYYGKFAIHAQIIAIIDAGRLPE